MLEEVLLKDGVRQRFIHEIAALVDQEVSCRGGVAGLAVRGGYHLLKKLKEDFVSAALDDMLEAFVSELEPLYREHGCPEGFGEFLVSNKERVARCMLRVTCEKRRRARCASMRTAYDRLSPFAQINVERSIPQLGPVVQRYIDELTPRTPRHCYS